MLDEIESELEEIDVEAVRREKKREQANAKTLEELVMLATARGYKSPEKWAAHIYSYREAKQSERNRFGSRAN